MISPATVFKLAFLPTFLLAMREWTAYFRAALKVRAQARAEGSDWPFLSDPKYMVLFVYMPDQLIERSDTPAIRKAKGELLALRRRAWKVLLLAIGLAILGFCGTIVYGVLFTSLGDDT